MGRAIALTLGWLALFAASATAHFNMLLPQSASVKKGQTLTFIYQWGHPFEHQLFDAPHPHSLIVRAPDGKKNEWTDKLEKIARKADSKNVTAYQFPFTPAQRGDYVFLLRTPPIWMQEDGEFLQDSVKVVLHVQVQKGWDAIVEDDFEFAPLTRPYGLRAGMVFQAQIKGADKESGSLVEIERYNATPPAKLPPDEHITYTAKTDRNNVVTATLPSPGWWCLTAARTHGTKMRDGKKYPLRRRCTLWVFVDDGVDGR